MQHDNDNDNDKPIKSLLKGKGLLPPVGLARLDSQKNNACLFPTNINVKEISLFV
jgi:hypothetical protein